MNSDVTIASHTHVLWASSRGDGTLDQAQNGGFFITGHVLFSWCFHRIQYYTVGTRGFFSPAAGIFGVGRRPKSRAGGGREARKQFLSPPIPLLFPLPLSTPTQWSRTAAITSISMLKCYKLIKKLTKPNSILHY